MYSRDEKILRKVSGTWATPNVWWRTKEPDAPHQQTNAKTGRWTLRDEQSGRDPKKSSSSAKSFGDELVGFVSNISMHGFRWLVEPTFSGWEKLVTIFFQFIPSVLMFVVVILDSAYTRYTTTPMVTTLFDTIYPISSVPFPAISICNNNRISRRQAKQYAARLATMNRNGTQESIFPYDIRELGKLYDNDIFSDADLKDFQHSLEESDVDNTNVLFDTSSQMESLSPQCRDILLRCVWRGEERNCLEKSAMFEQRNTQYGVCCTFNYVRPDSLSQAEPDPFYMDDTGPELGLVLLLNGSSNDYYYPLYNFMGFIVQVFNPNEFPDVPSGSVSEKLVDLGYESFIRIDSSTLLTEDETRRYSSETVQQRGCLFPDELPEKFGGRYKRSDCVVNCRIESIAALCNCRIFYLPTTKQDDGDLEQGGKPAGQKQQTNEYFGIPMCTLEHVSCLNHYRIKWSTTVLTTESVVGLEMEIQDGLYCPDCLPSCSDTTYAVSYQSLPLIQSKRLYKNILTGIKNVSDVALLRIFLGQPETYLYKQRLAVEWHEIVSNLGGIVGIVSGFSLIVFVEMIYFIGIHVVRKIQKIRFQDTMHENLQHLHIMP